LFGPGVMFSAKHAGIKMNNFQSSKSKSFLLYLQCKLSLEHLIATTD